MRPLACARANCRWPEGVAVAALAGAVVAAGLRRGTDQCREVPITTKERRQKRSVSWRSNVAALPFAPARLSKRSPRNTTPPPVFPRTAGRSEEHTSELQSLAYLVCRLLLEKKKKTYLKMVIAKDYS